MTPVAARRAPVTVRTEGAAVVLELSDLLDAAVGAPSSTPPTAAVADGPERVDIDLRSLQSWTQDGAAALVRCREICGDLPDGLHYRTGRGPGRAALLVRLHLTTPRPLALGWPVAMGTRILAVEDDERIRTAVKLALEDEGWAVDRGRHRRGRPRCTSSRSRPTSC